MAHCSATIYQQVTLSGDDEWPKVADAMIEAYFAIQEIIPRHFRTSHGRFPVRWESQNLWYFKMERCSENPPLILLHQLPLGNNRDRLREPNWRFTLCTARS